jgi:tetratricopeptide (TPR) repeat protein
MVGIVLAVLTVSRKPGIVAILFVCLALISLPIARSFRPSLLTISGSSSLRLERAAAQVAKRNSELVRAYSGESKSATLELLAATTVVTDGCQDIQTSTVQEALSECIGAGSFGVLLAERGSGKTHALVRFIDSTASFVGSPGPPYILACISCQHLKYGKGVDKLLQSILAGLSRYYGVTRHALARLIEEGYLALLVDAVEDLGPRGAQQVVGELLALHDELELPIVVAARPDSVERDHWATLNRFDIIAIQPPTPSSVLAFLTESGIGVPLATRISRNLFELSPETAGDDVAMHRPIALVVLVAHLRQKSPSLERKLDVDLLTGATVEDLIRTVPSSSNELLATSRWLANGVRVFGYTSTTARQADIDASWLKGAYRARARQLITLAALVLIALCLAAVQFLAAYLGTWLLRAAIEKFAIRGWYLQVTSPSASTWMLIGAWALLNVSVVVALFSDWRDVMLLRRRPTSLTIPRIFWFVVAGSAIAIELGFAWLQRTPYSWDGEQIVWTTSLLTLFCYPAVMTLRLVHRSSPLGSSPGEWIEEISLGRLVAICAIISSLIAGVLGYIDVDVPGASQLRFGICYLAIALPFGAILGVALYFAAVGARAVVPAIVWRVAGWSGEAPYSMKRTVSELSSLGILDRKSRAVGPIVFRHILYVDALASSRELATASPTATNEAGSVTEGAASDGARSTAVGVILASALVLAAVYVLAPPTRTDAVLLLNARAVQLMESGQYVQAIDLVQDRYMESSDLAFTLGKSLLELGREEELVVRLEPIYRRDSSVAALYGLGLLRLGKAAEAIRALEPLTTIPAPNVDVLSVYGEALVFSGRYDDALAALADVRRSDRDAAIVYADALMAVGRADEAVQSLRPLHVKRPDDRGLTEQYSDALLASGRGQAALRLLDPLYRADQEYAEEHSMELIEDGFAAEVIDLLKPLHGSDPDLVALWGLALYMEERYSEAVDATIRYYDNPAGDGDLALVLGLALFELERYAEIVDRLGPFVEQRSEIADLYLRSKEALDSG